MREQTVQGVLGFVRPFNAKPHFLWCRHATSFSVQGTKTTSPITAETIDIVSCHWIFLFANMLSWADQMDAYDEAEAKETKGDMLIVTADGTRIACFSDVLSRSSDHLKMAISMARRQFAENQEAQAENEPAAKRVRTEATVRSLTSL